jgi:glycosyltransferase involved in cell wall biosynthesis
MTQKTKSQGGTELMLANLARRVDLSGIHLIISNCLPLHPTKPNVLWQHLNTDQGGLQGLRDPGYVAGLDRIVFVSEWQRGKFIREFGLPAEKCVVIPNAIEPIAPHRKPAGPIRLIYTSTPWRGLAELVAAYRQLDRDDVELVVYSGTRIYGSAFHAQNDHQFQALYAELARLPRCTHHDFAPNPEVRRALTQAHILAYPNTWEETSCISAIEALAAGLKVVTTRNGALPETCGDWATYADLPDYPAALRRAIDTYRYDEAQVRHYNFHYGWDQRVTQWRALLASLPPARSRWRGWANLGRLRRLLGRSAG